MLGRTNAGLRIAFWIGMLAVMFVACSQFPINFSATAQEGAAKPGDEDAAAADESADDTNAAKKPQSLAWLILDANVLGIAFYVVLALLSIAGMAIGLERFFNLTRSKVIPPAFVERLRRAIGNKEDTLEGLSRLCETSNSPIANILRAGTLRGGRPLGEVEKGMEDAAAKEMAAIRSRNRSLSVVANVSPLVGLHGTVVGMIFSFRTASQAGLGKAELLAEGIYLALFTTAIGLTIAIPCLLLVAWFNAKAERYMRDIDTCLLETMPSFSRMVKS